MYIVGILAYADQVIDEVPEIVQGLNDLGYAVHLEQMGFNLNSPKIGDFYYEKDAVVLWFCRCSGDTDRCRQAAECFVENGVDAIVAMSKPAVDICLRVTQGTIIPIVFTHVRRNKILETEYRDLQGLGKICGVWDPYPDIVPARLALVTEVVPPPSTVHGIYNPDLADAEAEAEILRSAAQTLGLKLVLHPANSLEGVKEAVTQLQTNKDHALFRLSDPTTSHAASLMGAVAHEQYIPYIGVSLDELERCGSLFSLEMIGAGIQAANILDRLFKGEAASTLPFVEPHHRKLAVNLQAAQDLGLIISPAVLSKAQVVIPAVETTRLEMRFILLLFALFSALTLTIFIGRMLDYLYLFGLVLGVNFLVMLSIWIFLQRKVVDPIHKLAIAAEKIGGGDLNIPIGDLKGEGEVATLARALRQMKKNLKISYEQLELLNRNLQGQLVELYQAYNTLQTTQRDLELASRRIVEAEDSQRFALTTFIHDEIIRPLDELALISQELGDPDLIRISSELEKRIHQVRFDLSVPILKDIGLELSRLVLEILPAIYPNAHNLSFSLDLSSLDKPLNLEPALTFLVYRFVLGTVSNTYRHSGATQVEVTAQVHEDRLNVRVSDNGRGFDPTQMEGYIRAGHYFFHDIQIRVQQLNGTFQVQSVPGKSTCLEVSLPIKSRAKPLRKLAIRRRSNKV